MFGWSHTRKKTVHVRMFSKARHSYPIEVKWSHKMNYGTAFLRHLQYKARMRTTADCHFGKVHNDWLKKKKKKKLYISFILQLLWCLTVSKVSSFNSFHDHEIVFPLFCWRHRIRIHLSVCQPLIKNFLPNDWLIFLWNHMKHPSTTVLFFLNSATTHAKSDRERCWTQCLPRCIVGSWWYDFSWSENISWISS